MFALALTDVVWKWFEFLMNGIQDRAVLKHSLRDSILGDRSRENINILTFQFVYDLKVIWKRISMLDVQILEHFRNHFLLILTQSLGTDGTDTAHWQGISFGPVGQIKITTASNSSMLSHMTAQTTQCQALMQTKDQNHVHFTKPFATLK